MTSGGNIHDQIAAVAAAMSDKDIGTDNEMPTTLDGLGRLYLKLAARLSDMNERIKKLEQNK
jgi:chaperonin GroEL (HSP60 family)